MDKLPEEILYTIYKYKHQLEFCDVVTHIECQFHRFCPSCGQGISFFYEKRCNCPMEIRDDISVVSGIDINSDSSYESDYESDESYELDDLFIWDVEF